MTGLSRERALAYIESHHEEARSGKNEDRGYFLVVAEVLDRVSLYSQNKVGGFIHLPGNPSTYTGSYLWGHLIEDFGSIRVNAIVEVLSEGEMKADVSMDERGIRISLSELGMQRRSEAEQARKEKELAARIAREEAEETRRKRGIWGEILFWWFRKG